MYTITDFNGHVLGTGPTRDAAVENVLATNSQQFSGHEAEGITPRYAVETLLDNGDLFLLLNGQQVDMDC
jgi:hypothetical protein